MEKTKLNKETAEKAQQRNLQKSPNLFPWRARICALVGNMHTKSCNSLSGIETVDLSSGSAALSNVK